MGDEFMTIQKYGGGGTMDDIKIVQPMDVSVASYQQPTQQYWGGGNGTINESTPPLLTSSQQKQPDVNIVVVNGNNNEIDGKTIEGKSGKKEEINQDNIEKGESKREPKEETEKKGGSIWGSIFDTANLLVKKAS